MAGRTDFVSNMFILWSQEVINFLLAFIFQGEEWKLALLLHQINLLQQVDFTVSASHLQRPL